mmetsp:Transcript_57985/g.125333  ORF Transcript_57985/g.125333 Transcript_57985/m.125333 type:complete len:200 (+) Transcript_57985:159-758(+)
MSSHLPDRALAASHAQRLLEELLGQLIQGTALLKSPSIEVHVLRKKFPTRGGGDYFDGGHERKVGDGTIARNEVDHVTARCHLASDRLWVIPGAVHEKVTATIRYEPLTVLYHPLESHSWRLLHRSTQRLERDVVKASELVAARGVALCSVAMPPCIVVISSRNLQVLFLRRTVASLCEDVALGTYELVGLSQQRFATG